MGDTDHPTRSLSAKFWEGPWSSVTGGVSARVNSIGIPAPSYCSLSGTQLTMDGNRDNSELPTNVPIFSSLLFWG